MTYATLK